MNYKILILLCVIFSIPAGAKQPYYPTKLPYQSTQQELKYRSTQDRHPQSRSPRQIRYRHHINQPPQQTQPNTTSKNFPEESTTTLALPTPTTEKPIVVVIPSYNNSKWYKHNLNSVMRQNYTNYRIIYIDDCSTDETGDLVREYIQEQGVESKVTLIHNEERKGALANLYYAIHSCEDEEIIVTVDGDDWLAHTNVLDLLNQVYADPNIWMTYGQFKWHPTNTMGFCCNYSESLIKNNAFRSSKIQPSHLRTFYAKLFKFIKEEDLKRDGQFFKTSWDLAIMWPVIEMAGMHFKFIPEVLYIYNVVNPLNDFRIAVRDQQITAQFIRQKNPYKPLEYLFN